MISYFKTAQQKLLEARAKNMKPEIVPVTTLKPRQKGDQLTPDLRMVIGTELVLYETSFEDVMRKYNISIATAKRLKKETIDYYLHLRDDPNYKPVKKQKKRGRKTTITTAHLLELYEAILLKPSITLEQLVEHLESKFPDFHTSVTTIWRHLDSCEVDEEDGLKLGKRSKMGWMACCCLLDIVFGVCLFDRDV